MSGGKILRGGWNGQGNVKAVLIAQSKWRNHWHARSYRTSGPLSKARSQASIAHLVGQGAQARKGRRRESVWIPDAGCALAYRLCKALLGQGPHVRRAFFAHRLSAPPAMMPRELRVGLECLQAFAAHVAGRLEIDAERSCGGAAANVDRTNTSGTATTLKRRKDAEDGPVNARRAQEPGVHVPSRSEGRAAQAHAHG
jgi:hypothetical protein